MTVKRYHPFYISLHWLMAVLIIFSLLAGKLILDPMANTPAKIGPLSVHALTGILIALLLVIRLITRFLLPRPAPANEDNGFLRVAARAVHFLMYAGMIGMLMSGLGLSSMAGLPAAVRGEAPLPADFMAFPPRIGHGLTANLMIALIGLHIAAAVYHQFIKKGNLLARMAFGRS